MEPYRITEFIQALESFKKSQKQRNKLEDLKNKEFIAIEQFNRKMLDKQSQEDSSKMPILKRTYPIYHKAPEFVKLMKSFTNSGSALKFTTHTWDSEKFQTLEDFKDKIKKEWNNLFPRLDKYINKQLKGKIYAFLFQPLLGELNPKSQGFRYSWGSHKLKFGWSSPALALFMKDNSDPFNCPIPEAIMTLDDHPSLIKFGDYVNEFKQDIEIRDDLITLDDVIMDLWEKELGFDFTVDQDNTKGLSFFTDVQKLRLILKTIFKSFVSRTMCPEIEVKVEKFFDSNCFILKIIQKGSMCTRSIEDKKICCPSGGDFSTIIENVDKIADFSIVSYFEQDKESFRVNYTTSEDPDTVTLKEKVEKPQGFTYELKFYL